MLDLYTALAEPARRHMLDRLLDAEASVTDLVDAVGLSQTATSKHLRVLRECGLVRVRVDGQRRIYGIDPRPLREVDDWLDRYRARWNRYVDDLTRHLDHHPADHHPASTTTHEGA